MLCMSTGGRYVMEEAHALVNVRDMNLVCQYYKMYAQNNTNSYIRLPEAHQEHVCETSDGGLKS